MLPEGGNRNSGWRNTLLKPGMPLASLSLDGEMSSQHSEYWDTTPTLELLLREYRNTLGEEDSPGTRKGKLYFLT